MVHRRQNSGTVCLFFCQGPGQRGKFRKRQGFSPPERINPGLRKRPLQNIPGKAKAFQGVSYGFSPLAEGADWMSADRYIGVSGQSVAPDLYIAVGISGQIQHTVGMVDSKVVVAVNNDDKAPIFEGADYGIVADLYEALPAIVEAAK